MSSRITRGLGILSGFLFGFAPTHAEGLHFERHAIPLDQPIYAVEAIDVDGDGKLDLIAVGNTKVWALLAPNWKPVELAHNPGGMTIHAVALDCNGNGKIDLALGRASSDWIRYRESLAEGKSPKKPIGPDFTVAWIENIGTVERPWPLHILDRELHGVHGLWTGDINGNGIPDLIANSFAGPHLESSLAWFPAPKPGQKSKMPRRMITTGKATGRPHYMGFADMNGNGRGDVLLGASSEGSFTWWEQPTDLSREWERNLIANEPGATHPRPVDLNGNGKLDVIGSAGHGIGVMWYESPTWKRHAIDEDIRDVHAFDAADLNGNGRVDCAGCSFSQKIVRWWENVGEGRFVAHDIDVDQEQSAYDLKIIDLDRDGRLDILLAGRDSKNVVWYRNLGPRQ